MFDIFDKNVVNISQGDSVTLFVTPVDDETGEPVILAEGDSVVFAVASKLGEVVIEKVLTSANYGDQIEGALICEFTPSDTQSLPTGEYPYTCRLRLGTGVNITFISSSVIITETINTSGGN